MGTENEAILQKHMHPDITKEEALARVDTAWWEGKTDDEIVQHQLFTNRMMMPFVEFHVALANVLCRTVFLHEFSQIDELRLEYLGHRRAPSLEALMAQAMSPPRA